MAMDMLEHETFANVSSIAARGNQALISFGDDGTNAEQSVSFLCKRMEIDFIATSDLITDDASGREVGAYALVLQHNSVDPDVDTIAEQLDARLEDVRAHQGIIWRRYFTIAEGLQDDTDNIVIQGIHATFKTSKSFKKGFRFDKDETYRWAIFNPTAGALDAIDNAGLMVRYWGVNVQ